MFLLSPKHINFEKCKIHGKQTGFTHFTAEYSSLEISQEEIMENEATGGRTSRDKLKEDVTMFSVCVNDSQLLTHISVDIFMLSN